MANVFKVCKSRCFLTADSSRLVSPESPEANSLFRQTGQKITESQLEGLENVDDFFVPEGEYTPAEEKPRDGTLPVALGGSKEGEPLVKITRADPDQAPAATPHAPRTTGKGGK